MTLLDQAKIEVSTTLNGTNANVHFLKATLIRFKKIQGKWPNSVCHGNTGELNTGVGVCNMLLNKTLIKSQLFLLLCPKWAW